jgi:hypothetical protein
MGDVIGVPGRGEAQAHDHHEQRPEGERRLVAAQPAER